MHGVMRMDEIEDLKRLGLRLRNEEVIQGR